MTTAEAYVEAVTEEEIQQPEQRQKNQSKPKPNTQKQPPYAVILHNDDLNSMAFVVEVLRKVFHYSRTKSIGLMLKAHASGRSIVWTGALEVAELKADQLKSCGPDPDAKVRGATSLKVSVEPLPN